MKLLSGKYFNKYLFTGIVIFLIYIITISFTDILTLPQLKVQDILINSRYKIKGPSPSIKDIVLIKIDDETYYEYGEKWPWERNIFAGLIYELIKYKPKVIAFDLIFSGRSAESENSDLLFADSLRDTGNVILGSYFTEDGRYILPDNLFIKSALDYGFANKPQDPDKFVRRNVFFEKTTLAESITAYSFDLQIISLYYGIQKDSIESDSNHLYYKLNGQIHRISLYADNSILLNYTAKTSDFSSYNILDIFKDKPKKEKIKDKIVIIGTTGKIFRDLYPTPLGIMPGIGIIANSLLMFLDNCFLKQMPKYFEFILVFLFTIAFCMFYSRHTSFRRFIFTIISIAIIFSLSILAILNNLLFNPMGLALVSFVLFFTTETIDYLSVMVESIKLRKIAITDTLTGLYTKRYFIIKVKNGLEQALWSSKHASLVIVQLSNFPYITSGLKEDEIDECIKNISLLLKRHSRKTRGGDAITRLTDNEFCILLQGTTGDQACEYAQRQKNILEGQSLFNNYPDRKLSLLIGIVSTDYIQTNSPDRFIEFARLSIKERHTTQIKNIFLYCKSGRYIDPRIQIPEEFGGQSQLKYVADELKQKNEELINMIQKIKEMSKEIINNERLLAMGKAAASIHHEINNPIISIKGNLKVLEDKIAEMEIKDKTHPLLPLIKTAIDEISHLQELSVNLRDLYRPVQKSQITEPINIHQVIEETVEIIKDTLVKSKVVLKKQLDPVLPSIKLIKTELKQVLLNLFINAADAMPDGGELGIATKFKKTDDNQPLIEISISDTGCGIKNEDLPKIFDAFYTTKLEGKGTGLGLYTSLEIIKKYNGTIEVESHPARGSVFKIILPII